MIWVAPPRADLRAVGSGIWVAWPSVPSGLQTDLDENVVREVGLAVRMVERKIAAIDPDWSAILFARR